MKKPFILFFLSLFVTGLLYAQGLRFHGKLQNSIYGYESDRKHTRFYQYAQFSVVNANQHAALNGSLRALSDADASLNNDQRFKAYNLNLAFKKLLNQRVDLLIGRQFLHPGTVLGGLDGVRADVRCSPRWSMQAYGGVESSYQRNLSTQDRLTLGGLLNWHSSLKSDFQFLYLQKNQDGETLRQLTGLNVENRSIPATSVRAQVHVDLKSEDVQRFLLNARTGWSSKLSTVLEYKMQRPQVYANSFFTIFELETYQQVRAGAAYELLPGWSLDGQYRTLVMESGSANQLLLSMQNKHGSLGLIYESGDAGDQTGLMFDYAVELSSHFMASVYIDYSKYRTETVYEYDDQLANALRCSYQLNRHWYMDLEYQWLRNRFKDNDSRILNHISFRW